MTKQDLKEKVKYLEALIEEKDLELESIKLMPSDKKQSKAKTIKYSHTLSGLAN